MIVIVKIVIMIKIMIIMVKIIVIKVKVMIIIDKTMKIIFNTMMIIMVMMMMWSSDWFFLQNQQQQQKTEKHCMYLHFDVWVDVWGRPRLASFILILSYRSGVLTCEHIHFLILVNNTQISQICIWIIETGPIKNIQQKN